MEPLELIGKLMGHLADGYISPAEEEWECNYCGCMEPGTHNDGCAVKHAYDVLDGDYTIPEEIQTKDYFDDLK